MKNKNELVSYQIIAGIMEDLVKDGNFDDLEKAVESLMTNLKRRSIVN